MARPREFDRDDALLRAIAVFQDQGYAGSSTQQLLDAMQIGRQSMYDTFGDKHGLFLAALARYNGDSVDQFVRDMATSPAPLAGVRTALVRFAERAGENCLGCMGVGAVFELGPSDAEVVQLNEASGQVLRGAIEARLRDARAAGELARELDEAAAAQFVIATLTGLKAGARAGVSAGALEAVIDVAMRALRAR